MAFIELPRTRSTKEDLDNLFLRIPKSFEDSKYKSGSAIKAQIETSIQLLNKHLGHYRDKYIILTKDDEIRDYFRQLEKLEIGAIDTETTGQDSMLCDIVGVPVYGDGLPPAYIPLAHTSFTTGEQLNGQADRELVVDLLAHSVVKWVMHNGKFDYKVIKRNFGIDLPIYWDTFLAMRVLNENEPNNGLKELHSKFCGSSKEETHSYGYYFGNLPSSIIPIKEFTLYAAGDGIKTLDLYKFQKEQFEKPKLSRIYDLFTKLEMPILQPVADMELHGVKFDAGICNDILGELLPFQAKYQDEFNKLIAEHESKIKSYIDKNPDTCLEYPVKISSPSQLEILFYDILKYPVVDTKKPRTTDKGALAKFDTDITKTVAGYREFTAPIDMFLMKLPQKVTVDDSRIHCEFNQLRTKTGRFASKNPKVNWGFVWQHTLKNSVKSGKAEMPIPSQVLICA